MLAWEYSLTAAAAIDHRWKSSRAHVFDEAEQTQQQAGPLFALPTGPRSSWANGREALCSRARQVDTAYDLRLRSAQFTLSNQLIN